MSFWSTEKLLQKQPLEKLIDPFDIQHVKHGAYELSLGSEAFVTTDPNGKKQKLEAGDQVIIQPGQFGLLITHEVVCIPDNAIGFISIRFGIKRRGLINVSGFHVDPGFTGRLLFSVYNAGSQNIVLSYRDRVFMLWFSDLSQATKNVYEGNNSGKDGITSEDLMAIQGEIVSPAELKKRIDELRIDLTQRLTAIEDKIMTWRSITVSIGVALLVGGIFFALKLFTEKPPLPSNPPVESIRPAEPAQNINRNDSVTTEKNSNSTTPPANSNRSN